MVFWAACEGRVDKHWHLQSGQDLVQTSSADLMLWTQSHSPYWRQRMPANVSAADWDELEPILPGWPQPGASLCPPR